MKTTFLLTTIAAAGLILAACGKDENPGEDWDGRIHLSSSVATLTRASNELDTKIATGQTVWLYVDGKETDGNATLYYGKQLIAADNNAFTGADDMFFPANEESINFYAFHINGPGTPQLSTEAYPGSGLTHQVEQDQQSGAGNSGYAKSDLLYAQTSLGKEAAKTAGGNVALPFKHCLSKIEVVLIKGTGKDEMDIQRVEILNTKLTATCTPSKTDATLTVSVSGEVDADTHNPILIDNGITTDENSPVSNEAIIIPQKLTGKTAFIRVTLSTGGELIYRLDEETSFAPGNKYIYTITAKLTGLTVTSKIEQWKGDSKASGNAEME